MRTLVILPTYNEIGNLGPLLEEILDQGEEFNVLVIDDGSPDGTGLLADHYHELYPDRVSVIHRQGKLGLATAYMTGFRYGLNHGYDVMFEMDADFSHPPRYLPQFLRTLQEKQADVVLGSRYVEGGGHTPWPWHRRILSRGGSAYAGWMLGLPISDLTGGFKCFHRQVLEQIDLESILSSGYAFQIEMTYRAIQMGFTVVEMPFIFEDRREGQSKMSPTIVLEAFYMVARMRLDSAMGLRRVPKGHRVRS